MPVAKNHVTVGTEIPAELRDRLDRRADEEGRSRSDAIRAAIRFWLEYAEPMPAERVHKPKTDGKR
jgi:metal-responsive CopG/Arc/MetJ family transcriptional regulator